jgi:tetratricopeptide (TPR) repeat protein
MRRAVLLGFAAALPWCAVATSGSDPREAVQRLIDDGRFAEAQSTARALLAAEEHLPTPQPAAVAGLLEPLVAAMALDLECREECAALAKRALSLRLAAGGEDDPAVAKALVPYGMAQERLGDFPAAHTAFRRAVVLRERAGEHRDPLLIDALTLEGALLARTSRYEEARPVLERAVALAEAPPADDLRLARALHRRAGLAFNQGILDDARHDIERALQLRRAILRPDHIDIAGAVGLLALVETASGDYAKARPLYEEALDRLTRSYGADSPLLGPAHYNMALFLMDIGDLAGARPHMERWSAIVLAQFGPDHPDASGSGPGELMMEMGDYPAARVSLERSLHVREASFGPDADVVGYSALPLGELLLRMDDLEAAESTARRAVAVFEKNHGAASPLVSDALVTLGLILERRTHDQEAESIFRRAYDNDVAALGPDHPHTATVLGHLARLRFKRGERGLALDSSLDAIASLRGSLVRTARGLPERAALGYAATLHALFDLPCTILGGGPGSAEHSIAHAADVTRLWNEVVRSRALVLDEMAARHRTVLEHESVQVKALADQLAQARADLAHYLTVDGPTATGEVYRDRLRSLIEAKDRAEGALADRSAAFRGEIAARDVGLAGVLRALPPKTALVSFVRYDDLGAGASYLAFVHGAAQIPPVLVPLGGAADLEERVRLWRREVSVLPRSPGDETRYRDAAVALRRALWDPLAPHLKAASLVLLVPDGALSLVNLATLPLDDGRYLLEAGPPLHLLSAERDAVRPPPGVHRGRGILLVGAPDFQSPGTLVAASTAAAALPPTAVPPSPPDEAPDLPPLYRGLRSSCGDFRSLVFDPLPGAQAEIEEIAALWRRGGAPDSSDGPVVRLTGDEASEEAFKRQAPSHRILHLATHGFFVSDRCDSALERADDFMPPARGPHPVRTIESPLLLSGLAFAGANRREAPARDGADDGILTADEIASLDLRGVEWAMLSACGTGLGPSQNGEGVFGLRRTFQVAGARTVLMSLWDVEDQATRDWMRRLYERRLRGRTTVESLRDATLASLAARRAAGVSTHPFSWGAFVAAGDWR